MFNLEGIKDVEIEEKSLEKEAIQTKESFSDYSDCIKTESDNDEESKYDYSDCVKTQFDIDEEKRKLEELRTMFEDCGLINSKQSTK